MRKRMKLSQEDVLLFESSGLTHFSFLEGELGFKRLKTVVRHPKSRMDRALEIQFICDSVAVVIRWAPLEFDIAVDFVEVDGEQMPSKYSLDGDAGFARAITLDSLVELLTDGEIEPVLPQLVPGISFAETCRRADANQRRVTDHFDSVIREYARRVRLYSSDILAGRLGIFENVITYHREKWELKL